MAIKKINTIVGYDMFTGPIYDTIEISVPETDISAKQKNAARRFNKLRTQNARRKQRAENTKHK